MRLYITKWTFKCTIFKNTVVEVSSKIMLYEHDFTVMVEWQLTTCTLPPPLVDFDKLAYLQGSSMNPIFALNGHKGWPIVLTDNSCKKKEHFGAAGKIC